MQAPLSETIRAHFLQRSEVDSSSSTTVPGSTCPICQGSGWLRTDRPLTHPRFGKLDPCECQGDRELSRLRSLSGLHGPELAVTLDDIQPEAGPGTRAMLEACRRFIEQPAGFLTLWGGVGVGKSSCLYAITNALLPRGAVYISLHDLLEYLKGGFNAKSNEQDDANARLKRFISVPVLCLDEVDKVKATDWASEQLTALVDARFRSGLTGEMGTVLALNSDPALQSPWIASRLADGRCRVVHNDDRDAREFMEL